MAVDNFGRAQAFIRIGVEGIRPILETLENVAGVLSAGESLERVLERAARPIRDTYRAAALRHDATGNLAKSTTIKTKTYRPGVSVAIAGPRHTGSQGATGSQASGNHSWLVEFGSNGRRKPSSRGTRKTYVNVHEVINRRMTKVARLEDSDKACAEFVTLARGLVAASTGDAADGSEAHLAVVEGRVEKNRLRSEGAALEGRCVKEGQEGRSRGALHLDGPVVFAALVIAAAHRKHDLAGPVDRKSVL
jgi:hypothetical protein